ncbi:phosphomevalonate kinase isoform X2 [Procambarus clarkii]|nr:phosphomevalonate kinase-like isoform X2 [Procambarus clarkii]
MANYPVIIFLFSGKRKSGKDYITDLLQQRLDKTQAKTIRLSGPIKQQFATDNGLDYSQLLTASDYKEVYRLEMIAWSEAKRAQDKGFFIKAAIDMFEGSRYPVWIVSDMRRQSDLEWFMQHYSDLIYTVRITASKEAREQRGWVFTSGVDDAESECDLDNVSNWDQEVDNSNGSEPIDKLLDHLTTLCNEKLSGVVGNP